MSSKRHAPDQAARRQCNSLKPNRLPIETRPASRTPRRGAAKGLTRGRKISRVRAENGGAEGVERLRENFDGGDSNASLELCKGERRATAGRPTAPRSARSAAPGA